ncbi:MAG: hypothetical protein WBF90_23855 [Rivularia sp. (in: cyanobacteria)]|jgi:hypothetical protein
MKLKLNLLKISAITGFASILLIFSGKVPAETVGEAQGVINAIVLLTHEIAKDTNERLDDENKD